MFRLGFIVLFAVTNMVAQDSTSIKRVLIFQQELNKKFADKETSPLTPMDLKKFTELDFFKIDASYSILATFVKTPYETPFIMKTTTEREPLYVKYGEAHFRLQEQDWVLNIYQNQSLTTDPQHQKHLFLPFTDLSNGEISYEGGRFIDLTIPEEDAKTILIDFNTSYNPYCAYSERYSCPVPPEENHMEIQIPVGVKKYYSYEVEK